MERKPDPKWAKPPPEGQTVNIEVYKSGELVDTYKLAGEDVECAKPQLRRWARAARCSLPRTRAPPRAPGAFTAELATCSPYN